MAKKAAREVKRKQRVPSLLSLDFMGSLLCLRLTSWAAFFAFCEAKEAPKKLPERQRRLPNKLRESKEGHLYLFLTL